MKNSKKGISLIVLVITIIVIIILAAAVLLTLSNNNPIEKSNTAVRESDKSEIQSAVTLIMSSMMADLKNSVTLDVASGTTSAIAGIKLKVGDKYVGAKDSNGVWTTAENAASAYSLSADDLGVDATTLGKYVINEYGNVSAAN